MEPRLRLERFPPSAGIEQQANAELIEKWMKLRKLVGCKIHSCALQKLLTFFQQKILAYLRYERLKS